MFNITLVIAVCALAAKEVFYLNWYSVVRDCFCYLISIAVLLGTISNELVSWYGNNSLVYPLRSVAESQSNSYGSFYP